VESLSDVACATMNRSMQAKQLACRENLPAVTLPVTSPELCHRAARHLCKTRKGHKQSLHHRTPLTHTLRPTICGQATRHGARLRQHLRPANISDIAKPLPPSNAPQRMATLLVGNDYLLHWVFDSEGKARLATPEELDIQISLRQSADGQDIDITQR
jgi:hypothetical protein